MLKHLFLIAILAILSALAVVSDHATATAVLVEEKKKLTPASLDWFHLPGEDVGWIYGSFWDTRIRDGDLSPEKIGPPPYVKILMVGPFDNKFNDELRRSKCEFYYETTAEGTETSHVLASLGSLFDDIYPENQAKPYYVYCRPPNLDKHVPISVTLHLPNPNKQRNAVDATGYSRERMYFIRGQFNDTTPPDDGSVMVCIRPMYLHKYYNWNHLENFLIFFDMIGVDHFSFYDSGANPPEMYRILNTAVAAGISIDNPPWQLREWHGWEGHQTLWGELCAHKAIVEKFQYVLTVDIDEIVVPSYETIERLKVTSPKTILSALVDTLESTYPNASHCCFQNVFYPMDHFPDREYDGNITSKLVSFKRTFHLPLEGGHLKCLYNPHRLGTFGIHGGKPSVDALYEQVSVDPSIATLHHYRSMGSRDYSNVNIAEDTTVYDVYKERLVHNRLYKKLEHLLH